MNFQVFSFFTKKDYFVFEKQVNKNANKLVTTVSCYFNSSWFTLCCNIATCIYETVTIPIQGAIGINKTPANLNTDRNWATVKLELNKILDSLLNFSKEGSSTSQDKLKIKCLSAAREAIIRQLNVMPFFKEDFEESEEAANKRSKAVLTNLGAESEFATLDNDLRKVGGSTSLNTISNKHVIAKVSSSKKSD